MGSRCPVRCGGPAENLPEDEVTSRAQEPPASRRYRTQMMAYTG